MLFLPVPPPAQLTEREFQVEYLPLAINEWLVEFDDTRHEADERESDESLSREHGLPPEIAIPLDKKDIGIQLVQSKDCASKMIGYQVLVDNDVVAINNLFVIISRS